MKPPDHSIYKTMFPMGKNILPTPSENNRNMFCSIFRNILRASASVHWRTTGLLLGWDCINSSANWSISACHCHLPPRSPPYPPLPLSAGAIVCGAAQQKVVSYKEPGRKTGNKRSGEQGVDSNYSETTESDFKFTPTAAQKECNAGFP